jgi:hypothetical protein
MAQIGNAKGEYRGIIHRDDRELQAWLARRPAAEVLIPGGGSLMALLADAAVHRIDATPVLNGLIAIVKVAELAVGCAGSPATSRAST